MFKQPTLVKPLRSHVTTSSAPDCNSNDDHTLH